MAIISDSSALNTTYQSQPSEEASPLITTARKVKKAYDPGFKMLVSLGLLNACVSIDLITAGIVTLIFSDDDYSVQRMGFILVITGLAINCFQVIGGATLVLGSGIRANIEKNKNRS